MNKTCIIIMILIGTLISCSDNYDTSDCEYPDYTNCHTTKPKYGQLIIECSINAQNPQIPIEIYQGKIENHKLIETANVSNGSYTANVEVDYYYSVKATYKSGEKIIIAIDGDDVKSKSNTNCDSTCYSVENGSVDVRLKY